MHPANRNNVTCMVSGQLSSKEKVIEESIAGTSQSGGGQDRNCGLDLPVSMNHTFYSGKVNLIFRIVCKLPTLIILVIYLLNETL